MNGDIPGGEGLELVDHVGIETGVGRRGGRWSTENTKTLFASDAVRVPTPKVGVGGNDPQESDAEEEEGRRRRHIGRRNRRP